ncbi:MAG TPA: NAD(P)/FAD-dependent oxidoreductase [Candidatus Dormibacteraeota bacterium]|nr:NAD(P)/FAD-dependent oxidoreductase [Candidatus Dormibacteraeota bacterium]
MDREFDVVCLGGGVCGEAVAAELSGSGLTLAVVEERLVGGECPYWGCVPSKTMLRSAEVVAEAKRARELAAARVEVETDFHRVARRTALMARGWDDTGAATALARQGAVLIRGRGTLTGPRRVEVEGTQLIAHRGVVVCTGTVPVLPALPGLETVDPWTNREAVRTGELPPSLLVLGGGAVGVELAQAFARFGSQVTVVEGADRLLPSEEPEAGALLRRHLESEGIRVVTGARVEAVEREENGGTRLRMSGHQFLSAQRLLVATGRRPDLTGFDLEAAGVRLSHGWVEVDPTTLRASGGIWAGGDVTGLGGFTHLAHYHGTVIGRQLRGRPARANHTAVPRVTFTDPEVASVGLSEAAAHDGGLEVRTVAVDAGEAIRSSIHGFEGGLIKLVVDQVAGVLVGATVVSPRAGEIVSELTLAVRARIPISFMADTIHPYPTFSRVLQGALAEAAEDVA